MSILGVIVRTRPELAADLGRALAAEAGVEVAADPGDGRLILVIEDAGAETAASTLGRIAQWPQVMSTSLVYEYSGDRDAGEVDGYDAWRSSLGSLKGNP